MELHLAPLENVSCWAFRSLYAGASDSYTGMLSLTNLVKRNNTWEEVDTFPIQGQRQWIQIATSKETECYNFLKKLEEEIKKHPEKDNIYGIQLNCSCPSPGLIRIGQGPALIKRSTKVSNIIKELLKQDKYKVGVKVRLGLNEFEVKQRKIFTLFKELENISINNPNFTNVTIHFKHAQESSSKAYNYSLLNELASYKVPLIINGGIRSYEDLKRLIESISPENRKNIKGVMLGREAMKNPNCFLEIRRDIENIQFIPKGLKEIKEEFIKFCKEHPPKSIYLTTIKERTNL
ncbi:MAG: tRNA-dihydrouridine synthase family protein [Nanoarchaeota archaeon]|nr:tRNA-dihydrouridine synthase family protein [Nanoarchaeota archaeon]